MVPGILFSGSVIYERWKTLDGCLLVGFQAQLWFKEVGVRRCVTLATGTQPG